MCQYREAGSTEGKQAVYRQLLKEGKSAKKCTVCNRHLNAGEMKVFEEHVSNFTFIRLHTVLM